MADSSDAGPWHEVPAFWFPEGDTQDIDPERHAEHWRWRLHGGADDAITARFAGITTMAAEGTLDRWATTPEGRVALIIALDQFPRSLWRGTPRAFAQDPAALTLALAGPENGDYAALAAPGPSRHRPRPLQRRPPIPSAVRRQSRSSRAVDRRQGSSRRGRAGSSCLWSSVESPVQVGVSNQTLPEHRRGPPQPEPKPR